jgi:ferredoxin
VRIVLDPTACDGFGFCAELFPEGVGLDEWGYPVLTGELAPELVAAARAAVRACPRRALRLDAAGDRPARGPRITASWT